jgi:hypothetical protein
VCGRKRGFARKGTLTVAAIAAFPMSQAHGSRRLVVKCLTCSQNVAVLISDFKLRGVMFKIHQNPHEILHMIPYVCVYI